MKLAEISKEADEALRVAALEKHPVSNLEQIGISQRVINLLQTNGINDMLDLLSTKKDDLLKLQNFGPRQLQMLFEAISKYHLVENL
jgi:DNA-directed RNA polymerase alpha subunit